MLEWLEKWYESQCDNNWEHMFGIKIETIDNPGWEISIDLDDTEVNLESVEWILIGDFESRWIGYKIIDNKFEGACDPKNLGTLISIFKRLVENDNIDSNEVMKSMKN